MMILFSAAAEETATTEIAIAVRPRAIQDIARLLWLCRLREGLQSKNAERPRGRRADARKKFPPLHPGLRLRTGHSSGSNGDAGSARDVAHGSRACANSRLTWG